MDKTNFDDLGMSEDLSWETEEQEKKATFDRIHNLKKGAFFRALKERRLKDADNRPESFPEEDI